jgi:hypothetical protein
MSAWSPATTLESFRASDLSALSAGTLISRARTPRSFTPVPRRRADLAPCAALQKRYVEPGRAAVEDRVAVFVLLRRVLPPIRGQQCAKHRYATRLRSQNRRADYADLVLMPMWASDPAHRAACRATQVGLIQT